MPLDRPRAEKQSGTDVRVRQTVERHQCDLSLLGGQLVIGRSFGGAFADRLPRGPQLTTRALGKALHADRVEDVVGRAQLGPGFSPARLAAQPFTIDEVGAAEIRAQSRPAQLLDSLA